MNKNKNKTAAYQAASVKAERYYSAMGYHFSPAARRAMAAARRSIHTSRWIGSAAETADTVGGAAWDFCGSLARSRQWHPCRAEAWEASAR